MWWEQVYVEVTLYDYRKDTQKFSSQERALSQTRYVEGLASLRVVSLESAQILTRCFNQKDRPLAPKNRFRRHKTHATPIGFP